MNKIHNKLQHYFTRIYELTLKWQNVHEEVCKLCRDYMQLLSQYDTFSASKQSTVSTSSLLHIEKNPSYSHQFHENIFWRREMEPLLQRIQMQYMNKVHEYYQELIAKLFEVNSQHQTTYQSLCDQMDSIQTELQHFLVREEPSIQEILKNKSKSNVTFAEEQVNLLLECASFVTKVSKWFHSELLFRRQWSEQISLSQMIATNQFSNTTDLYNTFFKFQFIQIDELNYMIQKIDQLGTTIKK